MCEYVGKKGLKEPKKVFLNWITSVQKEIKKEYGIHFCYNLTGSGKRNMVIKQCNRNYFDLDYQLTITHFPEDMDYKKMAKEIKGYFRCALDGFRPNGFTYCEDSTQALTSKNNSKHFGFDIVIVYRDNDKCYILYNQKNDNNANNNDYSWQERRKMKNQWENLAKICGVEMWEYLRENYREKRHEHKDDVGLKKRKSFQILNESVNETLKYFNK